MRIFYHSVFVRVRPSNPRQRMQCGAHHNANKSWTLYGTSVRIIQPCVKSKSRTSKIVNDTISILGDLVTDESEDTLIPTGAGERRCLSHTHLEMRKTRDKTRRGVFFFCKDYDNNWRLKLFEILPSKGLLVRDFAVLINSRLDFWRASQYDAV